MPFIEKPSGLITTPYIVSLSGGVASAECAHRVIEKYGKEKVTLWFADTLWEDEDLYRFVLDCSEYFQIPVIRYCKGKTPLQVAEDEHIIPNSFVATCSRVLKVEPFVEFLGYVQRPATVCLGLGWHEQHRMATPKERYESMDGITVGFPLMWEPIENRPYQEVVKSWGIEPPRLYRYGWEHNNCAGSCVRQGVGGFRRLLTVFPARFDEVMNWEEEQRKHADGRANRSICKIKRGKQQFPITLKEIKQQSLPVEIEPCNDDAFSCFCSY